MGVLKREVSTHLRLPRPRPKTSKKQKDA